jgi:formylglycine-generating enzyme required for sulfatase activity
VLDLLVYVPAGGAADNPQLLDIDLRGRLRAIRVNVTDAAGNPLVGTATIVLRGHLEDDVTWLGKRGASGDSSLGELHAAAFAWPEPRPGWCWIPPGPGLCGDDLGIGQEDERPVRTPTTAGFWLAEHETTNAQFAAFLNAIGGSAFDAQWLDLDGPKCRVQWDADANAFATDAPNLPVVTVSWHGAMAYCRWLTETTGVLHRLPKEVEWEKAARGPGSRVYAYGDTYVTAAANQESGVLKPVGRFPRNGFGLFDMTGNAFEWTADDYRRGAYGGTSHAAEQQNEYRVLRGGSFVLDGIFVRNSMRMRLRPDVRADDVGFRVLRQNTDPAIGPVPDD